MTLAKVLLVDDEEDFTNVLSQRLIARGLSVECAANGRTALQKAREMDFDIAILDYWMPEMDGLATLKKLREECPHLHVIMLTGHGDVKSGVEAMKQGAKDYLEKPADLQELLAKISEAKSQKELLFEQAIEEKINKIMGVKGW
ncbi:MAG: response regulator [Candidatus Omnitrophota bacterium]